MIDWLDRDSLILSSLNCFSSRPECPPQRATGALRYYHTVNSILTALSCVDPLPPISTPACLSQHPSEPRILLESTSPITLDAVNFVGATAGECLVQVPEVRHVLVIILAYTITCCSFRRQTRYFAAWGARRDASEGGGGGVGSRAYVCKVVFG